MNAIRIIESGVSTTLQDAGRWGFQRFGVPVSGALDKDSLAIANHLVGNTSDRGALEMRFLGPRFSVEAKSVEIAICGAAIAGQITRDSESIPLVSNRSYWLHKGDKVSIGALRESTTAYLAVGGGFEQSSIMGSQSTDLKSGFGGWDGKAVEVCSVLSLSNPQHRSEAQSGLEVRYEPSSTGSVRVVLGPQDDYFADRSLETFLNSSWTVSQFADRMGMRLDGPVLEHRKGFNITSDGIVSGAIQVPGTGQPIVLLSDRQTSGGYPKIATVLSCDLGKLGRLGPGAEIQFQAVSAVEGAMATRAHREWLAGIVASIGPVKSDGSVDLDQLYAGNLISGPLSLDDEFSVP
ncbi:MAG: biotin-dependent carboxyltransferase family protein [Pseudomonadota bacterium]